MQISNAFGKALREVHPRHASLVQDALSMACRTGGSKGLEVRYILDDVGFTREAHIVRNGDVVEVITRRDVPMEPPPEERIGARRG